MLDTQAQRHHGLPWVLKRVWKLLDAKMLADTDDTALGEQIFVISSTKAQYSINESFFLYAFFCLCYTLLDLKDTRCSHSSSSSSRVTWRGPSFAQVTDDTGKADFDTSGPSSAATGAVWAII